MVTPLPILVSNRSFEAHKKDAWELVCSVVDFVNEMLVDGAFWTDEIPQKLVQAYWADYYLAQVLNGGHSQFMGNSRTAGKDPIFIRNCALAGLEAMGANDHLQLLESMIKWADENEEEARRQSGGNSAAALAVLDDRFYLVERETSMSSISAAWIRSWPELKIIPDEEYDEALEAAKALNPHRKRRLALHRTAVIREKMCDRTILSLRMAGQVCRPDEVCIAKFWPNALIEKVDGAACRAWSLHTDKGALVGTISDSWSAVYSRADHGTNWLVRSSDVDQLLGRVATADVDAMLKMLEDTEAATAIDLLLTSGRPNEIEDVAFCGCRAPDRTIWIVMMGSRNYCVDHCARETKLHILPDGTLQASATKQDVDRHLDFLVEKPV